MSGFDEISDRFILAISVMFGQSTKILVALLILLLLNKMSEFVLLYYWQSAGRPLSGKSQTVTLTSVASARYLDKLPGAKNHSVFST